MSRAVSHIIWASVYVADLMLVAFIASIIIIQSINKVFMANMSDGIVIISSC